MIKESFPKNNEYLDNIAKGQILYTNSDTLLREEPNSASNIIIVINKGIKVEYLGETIKKNDGTKYDKVKILKNELYEAENIGFVLRSQLSNNIISQDEPKDSMSIKSKTKMIQEATNILKSNIGFSMEYPKRVGGFYNKKYDDKYYFDCSSFCTTILNRTFDFPPPEDNKDKDNILIWSTHCYFDNIKKEDSLFKIVEFVNTPGKCLDLKKLQIGDLILGRATKINNGINHIVLYAGEEYIIHCTRGRYLGIETNEKRNGVVKEKLNDVNYYTELETLQNIENGNITHRFDSEIFILRYKEKKVE